MDEYKLDLYLKKCELQYRAEYGTQELDWLTPHCGDVKEIAQFLRELGFRIRNIVDEEPWPGEKHQWVETTSGIIVYVNDKYCKGLFGKGIFGNKVSQ